MEINQIPAIQIMIDSFDLELVTNDSTGFTMAEYRSKLRAVSVKTETPTDVSYNTPRNYR